MNPKQTLYTAAACCVALSSLTHTLRAQAPAAPVKPEMTMEQRRASIVNLERHIAEREERLGELREDIRSLDTRVEKRVDRMVDILVQSKDSNSSKWTVSQTKEKAIVALRKTIKYYDEKRRAIRQMLLEKSAINADLESDLEKIDARVEKRVSQIMELTKSFTPDQDVEKYDEYSNSSWGWSWTERSISDDWRQNRRDGNQTALENKRVKGSLKKSVEYLESRVVWLQGQLEQKDISPEEKALYEDELARNTSLVSIRQAQIDELDTPGSSDQPSPVAVGQDEAHNLAKLLDDTADDVRDDFYAIFSKYSELNQEREQIASLQANLEARKKWMAEHGEEAK